MKPNKKNSCIYILSGRHNVLEECIERLYDFYNNKYDFPVYVYYFDDIYTSSKVAKKLEHKYKIRFISQPTKIPSHINHKDLYFNKNYNYVKRSFGPERLNYLHMNDFVTNTNNQLLLDQGINYSFAKEGKNLFASYNYPLDVTLGFTSLQDVKKLKIIYLI